MLAKTPLSERCRGRWPDILTRVGVDARYLNGKAQACPLCQDGTDRFTFDDKAGAGTWICRKCSPMAGDGVNFVERFLGLDFKAAAKRIEELLPGTHFVAPKAKPAPDQLRAINRELWSRGAPLDGFDLASRWLLSRGFSPDVYPPTLRCIERTYYRHEDGRREPHPAMLAAFRAPDSKSAIVHRTFLSEPGCKAKVPKPRMLMPGVVPPGGAVRLGPAAETMGIAEGIESALAASVLHGIVVWAALSAINLMKWKPPEECRHVIIFGDLDDNFEGQVQSYNLAHRLVSERDVERKARKYTVEVNFTLFHDTGTISEDWNDALRA